MRPSAMFESSRAFRRSRIVIAAIGACVAAKVEHLGQAAWTTGSGDLHVFDGHETITILALSLEVHSPSTATAKVEALARKLL